MTKKTLLGIVLAMVGIILFFFVLNKSLYVAHDSSLDATSTSTDSELISGAVSYVAAEKEWPQKLLIPKLNIDAPMQYVGINAKGNMGDPNNFTDVAWYKLGPKPGEIGSAVMAGHEDNGLALDGVFKHLDQLKVGDDVYVIRKDGVKLHFKVVETAIYPFDNAPRERIFAAKDGKAHLNLITCAGSWLASAHTNDKRLVVYTDLVKD